MLIGNYSVLNKNPARAFGGSTVSDTPSQWQKSGSYRGRFTNPNFSNKSSIPQGYRVPYCYIMPMKAGELASLTIINGQGTFSNGNLAGGLNGECTINGMGQITNADLALIVSAVATIAGSGTFSADIKGKLEAAATLAGTGDFNGALGALASAVCSITSSGAVSSSDLRAIGHMSADISPFTTLSPENLAASVWNSLASEFNKTGTMGKAVSDAGSAGNPWSSPISGNTNSGTFGEKVGKQLLTEDNFIGLK